MFERVLVGIDHVDASRTPLWEMVGRLSAEGGAEVVLAHVTEVHPPRFGFLSEGHGEVDKILADARDVIQTCGGNVVSTIEARVGTESPAKALADLARSEKCDLIVLGTHTHGAWSGALLGSVGQRVAGRSSCPVLLVPCE